MYIEEMSQRIEEIKRFKVFIYPSEKPSVSDMIVLEELSSYQKAVYSLIIELEIEREELCRLLGRGRLNLYESLLACSALKLKLRSLRGLLWASLYSEFENKLEPGENEVSIKKNFCVCISRPPNGYEGEKEIFYLGLPD